MHTYEPQFPPADRNRKPVSPTEFTYRNALDVVEFAAREPLTTWHTWPKIWHLDREGRWQCCSKGSSHESVRTFAEVPRDMLDCRRTSTGLACPNYWVILEARHPWMSDLIEVSSDDEEAFVRLRHGLGRFGVNLLDVVVFDQDFHWWSLCEQTSGSTDWTFTLPRPGA